jgi:hypothetical protein
MPEIETTINAKIQKFIPSLWLKFSQLLQDEEQLERWKRHQLQLHEMTEAKGIMMPHTAAVYRHF